MLWNSTWTGKWCQLQQDGPPRQRAEQVLYRAVRCQQVCAQARQRICAIMLPQIKATPLCLPVMPKMCPFWLHKETTFKKDNPKNHQQQVHSPCYAYQDLISVFVEDIRPEHQSNIFPMQRKLSR